ncbi:MAG: lipid A biosynthesis acyltransferase [Hyphomicrobiales bacterium]|nr:lipid A biosynthesis acyltransferase [Hyphomicrobiales bacterium]
MSVPERTLAADWRARVRAGATDVRYRAEYVALRILIALIRAMPIDVATRVVAFFWRLIAPRLRRHRRALENLAIAFPEKSPQEREAIALAMWANLGRVMAETIQLDRILADPTRIEIATASFARYRDKQGPIVGASLHMGNWELAIWPLTSSGKNPAAVYREVKNPYVDRYLRDQRRDLYPGGLFAKGDIEDRMRIARQMTDFVRNGRHLGVVCDLHDRDGLRVPFFGRDAPTTPVAALIARRTGARVWMARCLRIGEESRFRIDMVELKIPRTRDISADVRAATAAMQVQFEAWIREAPEQWMWSNRRWS